MKQLILALSLATVFVSCKKEVKTAQEVVQKEETKDTIMPITDDVLETAIIYEANIRQYSPEGSFEAFTKDIPQLKQLGVKVIWLMPVFPISETKRKATGGPDSKFATDFPIEEQAKYLGSYYAVTDFTKINPEFGTIDDFRELIKTAHQNDIYVILDWVPNHTGWDHSWIKEHPEYYTQNDAGEIIHPEGTDWTDVADLNYDNQDMRKEMIEDLMYWVKDEGVDGFRCDVAGSVPVDFWQQAIPQLRAEKPLFMLAEAWEPALLKGDSLFDMCYSWEGHHIMNKIAQGEMKVSDLKDYFKKVSTDYEPDDILMNFVTNHDENSWNGTIEERLGDASGLMTSFSYVIPGMPLIYSGQEYGMNHRLKFFEKDSIPKTKGKAWDLLKKLGNLKRTSSALNGGKHPANLELLELSTDDVLFMTRSKNGVKLLFIANMSDKEQTVENVPAKKYLNYLTNTNEELNGNVTLQPWEYKILIE